MGPAFLLQIHLATGRLSKAPEEPAKASWLVTDAGAKDRKTGDIERTHLLLQAFASGAGARFRFSETVASAAPEE